MTQTSHCLGLEILPICEVGGTQSVYFSIGEGVAALSLLLVIPQFVKPLFRFRLRARGVRDWMVYGPAIIAFVFVVAAAIVPLTEMRSIPILGWPVFWEISAGLLFLFVYVALASAYFLPVRASHGNMQRFAQSAAGFLAETAQQEYADFSREIVANVPRIINISTGADFQRARNSAFYAFTFRRQLRAAQWANSLLGILADDRICRSLVDERPWQVGEMARSVSKTAFSEWTSNAGVFFQSLAKEALLSDRGMLAREVQFQGFRHARVVLASLFGNHALNSKVLPFQSLNFFQAQVTEGYISRLNAAAEAALIAQLQANDLWTATNFFNLASHYGALARSIPRTDDGVPMEFPLARGVEKHIELLRAHLEGLPEREYALLFSGEHSHTLVEAIAQMTTELIEGVANDFECRPTGRFGSMAFQVLYELYPSVGDQPDGCDPIQQATARHLIAKVSENMEGWYPSVSKVLLDFFSNYASKQVNPRSAFGLLQNAFYLELKKFAGLYDSDRERALTFLPDCTRYDRETDTFTHRYFSGNEISTALGDLQIDPVSFVDEAVRRRHSQ